MREKALKLLEENESHYRAGTGAAYNVASIYEGLGDKEKAFEWLDKDIRDQSTWNGFLMIDPVWEDVRTDPRFVALAKKVGFIK
jgi:hypothetical protein